MPENQRGIGSHQVSALERHAQTGLTVILVGLLAWVGNTTQNTQIKVAELAIEMSNIKSKVSAPDKRVDDLTRRLDIIEAVVLQGAKP